MAHTFNRVKIVLIFCVVVFGNSAMFVAQDSPVIIWTKWLDDRLDSLSWNASNSQIVYMVGHPSIIDVPRILNLETGHIEMVNMPAVDSRENPYWSPDGRWIAIGTDQVYLIDPEANTVESIYDPPLKYGWISDLRWNNSPLRLAVYTLTEIDEPHIIVIDPEMQKVESFFKAVPDGNSGLSPGESAMGFDWSPNGELFAIPNSRSLSIGFWTRSGKLLEQMDVDLDTRVENPELNCFSTLSETNDIVILRWDTTSRTLAMGSWYGLGLCTLKDDGTILHQAIDESPTYSLAWSPDGAWLTSGESLMDPNSPSCEVRLFDVHNDYQRIESNIGPEVCSVYYLAWSSDSKHLAAATDEGLWIGEMQ